MNGIVWINSVVREQEECALKQKMAIKSPKNECCVSTWCSIWKITKVRGCSSKTVHIWPYIGKAKIYLICGSLIEKW